MEGWAELAVRDLRELAAVVALHARNLGEQGVPAHQPVLQASLLDASLPAPPEVRLAAVAADAHAVGLATRLDRHRRRSLRDRLPVLELPSGEVLACVVGPLDAELLDGLLGRAFSLAAGTGARVVALDLSGAEDVDAELVLDTAAGFPEHELAGRVRLVLTGVDDPDAWRARLSRRGTDPEDVAVRARVTDLEG
jgi:hypothetical protein